MSRVLIIGAGGVGTVVAHKVARNEVFTDIMLASRTKSKCDEIAAAVGGNRIKTAQVDADNVSDLVQLMKSNLLWLQRNLICMQKLKQELKLLVKMVN
jgi:saccharopine dehydrogenase (NAD+, L-lysine-forming)